MFHLLSVALSFFFWTCPVEKRQSIEKSSRYTTGAFHQNKRMRLFIFGGSVPNYIASFNNSTTSMPHRRSTDGIMPNKRILLTINDELALRLVGKYLFFDFDSRSILSSQVKEPTSPIGQLLDKSKALDIGKY